MEISYRREIKHNYLVITPDCGTIPGYEARMLAGNEIKGCCACISGIRMGIPFTIMILHPGSL